MTLRPSGSPDEVRGTVKAWQAEGLTVGFVPTMGALHEGHLSLIRASVGECDRTVLSIYVNPTQFGRGEDLKRYPRRLEQDCRAAEQNGVDLVFCPTNEVMYPAGSTTYVSQDSLIDVLEGASRPGHFRGVLTVVCKLLSIVPADRAYFGQKDFQQTVVVGRMVKDLSLPVSVRVVPTVRDADGLALSSRNDHLDQQERHQASCLHRALTKALQLYRDGERNPLTVRAAMQGIIEAASLVRTDYIEIVDCETLEPVKEITDRAVVVLAVRIGQTRLIDNMPLVGTDPKTDEVDDT